MRAHSWVVSLVLLSPLPVFAADASGEHLVYTVGCVNCHHQTPKEVINAPPLIVVKAYSFPEFTRLMKTGVTRTGRDLVAESNVMGIVAKEQFSHFHDAELKAVYEYLTRRWTPEKGVVEERKIPLLYRAEARKGEGGGVN